MTSPCHVITSAAFGVILGRPNEFHCFLLAAPFPSPWTPLPHSPFSSLDLKMAGQIRPPGRRAVLEMRRAGCVWPRRAADRGSVERDEQASSCLMQRKQRSAAVDLAKGAATKASSGGCGGADPAQGDGSRRRRWIWRTVDPHGGGVRAGAAEMANQIMVKHGHLEATAGVQHLDAGHGRVFFELSVHGRRDLPPRLLRPIGRRRPRPMRGRREARTPSSAVAPFTTTASPSTAAIRCTWATGASSSSSSAAQVPHLKIVLVNRCAEPAAEGVFANFSLLLTEDPVEEPDVIDLGTVYEEDRTKFPLITGSEDENDEDIETGMTACISQRTSGTSFTWRSRWTPSAAAPARVCASSAARTSTRAVASAARRSRRPRTPGGREPSKTCSSLCREDDDEANSAYVGIL
ncbi:hypothetical protein VPH35_119265 [Triticum aestivum]